MEISRRGRIEHNFAIVNAGIHTGDFRKVRERLIEEPVNINGNAYVHNPDEVDEEIWIWREDAKRIVHLKGQRIRGNGARFDESGEIRGENAGKQQNHEFSENPSIAFKEFRSKSSSGLHQLSEE